jgi:soluble lytic murein transglycosylase-like protein
MSKHKNRRRVKRVFMTVETIILFLLVAVGSYLVGSYKNNFEKIDETMSVAQSTSDAIAAKLDSLDAHVAALHEITEANRARSQQIATGTKIIISAKKDIEPRFAAKLARIIYDESEFSSSVEYPFLLAVIAVESRFNPDAVSPAGAKGLGQLMPATAESMARQAGMSFKPALLTDPRYNVKLSVQYLGKLKHMFQTNVLVAAAYNGGPLGAQKYKKWIDGEIPQEQVHPETVSYVSMVMEKYYAYRSLLQ